MTMTDEAKLKHEFLQRWESLEKLLRKVASDQICRAKREYVLTFLEAIEQVKPHEKKQLLAYQFTHGEMSQPSAYVSDQIRGEIDGFMKLADVLENRLRSLIEDSPKSP